MTEREIRGTIEKEIRRALVVAQQLKKPVLFPDTRKMSHFFSSWERIPDSKDWGTNRKPSIELSRGSGVHKPTLRRSCISRAVHGDYRCYDVEPHQVVVDAICDNMLMGDLTITFRMAVRESGEALVYAQYEQILGDCWLGFIDPATIETNTGAEHDGGPVE